MAFKILSQMEETRKRKENSLNLKGTTAALIVTGSFALIACIFFILIMSLPGDTSTATTADPVTDAFCYGILALFGLISLLMLITGMLRMARVNRELTTREAEFQQHRSGVISYLDSGVLPQVSSHETSMISPAPGVAVPLIASEPHTSNKGIWIIAGFAIFVVILLCSALAVVVFVSIQGSIAAERTPINTVLDQFMKTMLAEDVQSAKALFSPSAQQQLSVDDFDKLIQLGDKVLFMGYSSISADNITLNKGINTNPNTPQGTYAEVTGSVYYDDGSVGSFSAVLEKVDGKWMLYNININVPVQKYQSEGSGEIIPLDKFIF